MSSVFGGRASTTPTSIDRPSRGPSRSVALMVGPRSTSLELIRARPSFVSAAVRAYLPGDGGTAASGARDTCDHLRASPEERAPVRNASLRCSRRAGWQSAIWHDVCRSARSRDGSSGRRRLPERGITVRVSACSIGDLLYSRDRGYRECHAHFVAVCGEPGSCMLSRMPVPCATRDDPVERREALVRISRLHKDPRRNDLSVPAGAPRRALLEHGCVLLRRQPRHPL